MFSFKHYFGLSLMLAVLALIPACATVHKPADIDNPQVFSADGMTFKFPGNWHVNEDVSAYGLRQVVVSSAGNAEVRILEIPQRYAFALTEKLTVDIEEDERLLAPGAMSTNRFEPVALTTPVGDLAGIRRRFDVTRAGMRVSHTSDNYMLRYDDVTLYLSSRVRDEELSLAQSGINQIFGTLSR